MCRSATIAQAIALQLDYVSLFGGVIADGEGINLAVPPNSRGVLGELLPSWVKEPKP